MKKYKINAIKTRRSYSSKELAEVLNVHVQTIRSWRKSGLTPIEGCASPFLFMGEEVRRFLKARESRSSGKLESNECLCFKCKVGVVPVGVEHIDTNILIGQDIKSIRIRGKCPHCGSIVNRFSSTAQIEALKYQSKKGSSQSETPSLF